MDHSGIVHGCDSCRYLGPQPGDLLGGQGAARFDGVPKAVAVYVVHDESERIPLDDDVVHLDDVRARGPLKSASLLEERVYDTALGGYGLVQHLECERPRRIFRVAFPDFSLSP